MRITGFQKEAIVTAVKKVDSAAKVWLFGSRADDNKKGGDIDIGVLSQKDGVMEKIAIRRQICSQIGEQKIDIVMSKDGQDTFFKHVIMNGVLLCG